MLILIKKYFYQVSGVRSIYIPDSTLLKMRKPANLFYYRGVVTFGNKSEKIDGCDCIVFKYHGLETAATKYAKLVSVNHKCVLEPLGHGLGFVGHQKYSFLALRPFEKTFEAYIVKGGLGIDQNGRFNHNFIKLVRYTFYLLVIFYEFIFSNTILVSGGK